MKIEIKHKGSCLGETDGSGRGIVRDALAKGLNRIIFPRLSHRINLLTRIALRCLPLPESGAGDGNRTHTGGAYGDEKQALWRNRESQV
jgi:hypothetical protein